MDPRHRDRVAFVRICSGRFERGMRVTNARTGRVARAQPRARGLRPGPRGARRGLPGRRRRRRLRRRRARRRHAATKVPEVRFPPIPTLTPGVVRDDLQPRLRPLQAVPPRAGAARPGGRRARAAPRVQPGPRARARRRRADAVRGRRRAPEDRVRRRRAHPDAALDRPRGGPTTTARRRCSPTPARPTSSCAATARSSPSSRTASCSSASPSATRPCVLERLIGGDEPA